MISKHQKRYFYSKAFLYHLTPAEEKILRKQLLQLCTPRTVWPDSVIRSVLVRSGQFSTLMLTNEKQKKLN